MYFLKFLLTVFMVIYQLKADIILNVEQRAEGFGCGSDANGGCNREPESVEDQNPSPDQGPTTNKSPAIDHGPTTDQSPATDQGPTTDQSHAPGQGSLTDQSTAPSNATLTTKTTTTAETTTENPCAEPLQSFSPNNMVQGNGSYQNLEFYKDTVSYFSGKCICESRNGSLLAEPFEDYNDFVAYFKLTEEYGNLWVDITKVNGSWKWANGSAADVSKFDSQDSGNCAYVFIHYQFDGYSSSDCNSNYQFICKKN